LHYLQFSEQLVVIGQTVKIGKTVAGVIAGIFQKFGIFAQFARFHVSR